MLDELVRRVVIMGLDVVDPVGYSLYRVRERPVLVRHGGRVEYDFVVDEVIESPTDAVINRVVALSFPGVVEEAAFHDDDAYCLLHATLYVRAVASTTVIGTYHAPGRSQ
jgi:uncharacterized protein (DUF1330 family)